jgi:hypothetical protein
MATAFGCGLFDDVADFTIDTGWKSVTVDSDSLGVVIPGTTIPSVPCTKTADVCAQASSGVSCNGQTYGCKVQCSDQGACDIVADAQISDTVDVSKEVKDNTSASAISKVTFNYMLYKVTENTLTFDTPQLKMYVGPNTATSTADAGVVEFATLKPIPKGQTTDGEMPATEAGKRALAGFVKDYQTPFKVFLQASMRFGSGDPLPQGKLTMQVNGFFKIEPI